MESLRPHEVGGDPKPLDLMIQSATAELGPLRRAVEAFCQQAGLDVAAVADVGLCVNEAIANIIRHAYGNVGGKPIHVRVWAAPTAVHVAIRDWGVGRDPTRSAKAHQPEVPGGLGLVCMQKLMSTVSYQPQRDGMLLTMTGSGIMDEPYSGSELIPSLRRQGNTLIMSVKGEIDLHNSPELRTELLSILKQHNPQSLVLNLAQVPYMDSSAVAVLVESLQLLRRAGGRLYLVELQPRVRGLIEIARLGALFSVSKDEAEALAKDAAANPTKA